MSRLAIFLGTLSLLFAGIDLIHGQHNGDVHRFYIHVTEFVFSFAFLCVIEVQAFRGLRSRYGFGIWSASSCILAASSLAGFLLFGLAGGSAHGDGGPLAGSFALFGLASITVLPGSLLGLGIAAIRKHRRSTHR